MSLSIFELVSELVSELASPAQIRSDSNGGYNRPRRDVIGPISRHARGTCSRQVARMYMSSVCERACTSPGPAGGLWVIVAARRINQAAQPCDTCTRSTGILRTGYSPRIAERHALCASEAAQPSPAQPSLAHAHMPKITGTYVVVVVIVVCSTAIPTKRAGAGSLQASEPRSSSTPTPTSVSYYELSLVSAPNWYVLGPFTLGTRCYVPYSAVRLLRKALSTSPLSISFAHLPDCSLLLHMAEARLCTVTRSSLA